MDQFSLSNKNILISGASSGLGRSIALACSKAGANVILLGRNKEKLNCVSKELEGNKSLIFSQDLLDFDNIESIVGEAVNQFGKIDGFVHSAGIEMSVPLRVLKPKHYQDAFNLNVISAFEMAKILSKKKYVNPDCASFVFISSVMSLVGEAVKIAYCASKGALVSGSKAMALELASKKIRVNCISPALIKTPMSEMVLNSLSESQINDIFKMHPLGFGEPCDVANACIFLLSKSSKWITGTNLILDGGYSAK